MQNRVCPQDGDTELKKKKLSGISQTDIQLSDSLLNGLWRKLSVL